MKTYHPLNAKTLKTARLKTARKDTGTGWQNVSTHLSVYWHDTFPERRHFSVPFASRIQSDFVNRRDQDPVALFTRSYQPEEIYTLCARQALISPIPEGFYRYNTLFADDLYFQNALSVIGTKASIDQGLYEKSSVTGEIRIDRRRLTPTHYAGPCVWLPVFENLGHTICEVLPILVSLNHLNIPAHETTFLVDAAAREYCEMLEALGVPKANMVFKENRWITCDELYWSSFQTSGHMHWPSVYLDEVLALASEIPCVPVEPEGDLLYISRADAATRRVVNEVALFQFLKPFGFKKIVPGELTVMQQMSAFRKATAIVAPHGMGTANSYFAQNLQLLLEIFPQGWVRDYYFRAAQIKNAAYGAYIVGSTGQPSDHPHDITVNLSEFAPFFTKLVADHLPFLLEGNRQSQVRCLAYPLTKDLARARAVHASQCANRPQHGPWRRKF